MDYVSGLLRPLHSFSISLFQILHPTGLILQPPSGIITRPFNVFYLDRYIGDGSIQEFSYVSFKLKQPKERNRNVEDYLLIHNGKKDVLPLRVNMWLSSNCTLTSLSIPMHMAHPIMLEGSIGR